MLNLVASYEAGIDHNLDYQIRSVFTFIVKMKDMTDMKRELFAFSASSTTWPLWS